MQVPCYSGFYFSHKKNPQYGSEWYSCKEDAGRFISTHAKTAFLVYYNGKDLRKCKQKLEKRLVKVSEDLGVNGEISAKSITGQSHVLRITVPKEWFRHRVATHLLLTYIRRNIRGSYGQYGDSYHLENAAKLIRYAQTIGLRKFNTQMKRMTGYPRMRGVVEANNRMKRGSSKIYKKA